MEVRKLVIGAEVRVAGNFQIVGKAVTYGVLSPTGNLGPNKAERVAPGCFHESLENGADVKCLVNHNPDKILGRRTNKTLVLADGPDALRFTVQLNPASQAHQDVYASVQRGDLNQCSFAFEIQKDSWADGKDAVGAPIQIRTLLAAKLLDVSIVTYPFYSTDGATAAEARARKSPATKYVTATQNAARAAELKELAQNFRKLARAMAVTKRDANLTSSLEGNMEQCQEFLECAYAFSGTIAGLLADDNASDYDFDDEDYRAIGAAHTAAHNGIEACCKQMAQVRALYAKQRRKSGRK